MINNSNIEELVKQKLQDFESEVSANVWNKIDSSLNQLQPSIDPSAVKETVVNSAGTNITAWVAGITAAVVGVVTVGVLLFSNLDNSLVGNEAETIAPVKELVAPIEENIIDEENSKPEKTETNQVTLTDNINKENNSIATTDIIEKENTKLVEVKAIADKSSNELEDYKKQEPLIAQPTENNSGNNINTVIETKSEITDQVIVTKNQEPELLVIDEIIEKIEERENANALTSSIGLIPNVFTPNGDGINDNFIFNLENIAELKVNIYNAKGELVYQIGSTEKRYWNGNLRNGQASPVGSYYYAVYATGFDKQKHQRKGSLYLNR